MSVALSIAGSDSGGGAGIQADLKTFEAHGVFGTTVITALTAQNTMGVERVWPAPADMVRAQLHAILDDFEPAAAKTGMLFNEEIIRTVAEIWGQYEIALIVDPVMVASSGDHLLEQGAIHAMEEKILPLARVITPNLHEAEILAGMSIKTASDMEKAAELLIKRFPKAHILLKGGHLPEEDEKPRESNDLLLSQDSKEWILGSYLDTPHTHGTGCTLSAAITANICLGYSLPQAIRKAKDYVFKAINHAWIPGKGRGSLRHNYQNLSPIT